jgi:hypothetical protein
MKKFVLFLLVFSHIEYIRAESSLTKKQIDEINQLNVIVLDSLSDKKIIKTNRVTSEGKLEYCELEFRNVYQDIRNTNNGVLKTVLLNGSFSVRYFNDRKLIYALKGVPSIFNVQKQTWENVYPTYLSILINGELLDSHKYADFKCGDNGRCLGYKDTNFGIDIMDLLYKNLPFDPEIKISLNKSGMDTTFKLSELSSSNISIKERESYLECVLELSNNLKLDLEKDLNTK